LQGPEAHRHRRVTESFWPADESRPLLHWTLGQALREAAAAAPDRPALVEGLAGEARGRRWNFAELLAHSERVAAALATKFAPGERVAVWAPNIPEWELMLYGCAIAGLVLVTVNPAYKARELEYVLAKSGASGLFAMDAYRGYDCLDAIGSIRPGLPALREVVRIAEFGAFEQLADGASQDFPAVDPLDACVIMFTSGTTGAQKGVIFNHRGVINMSRFIAERGGLAEGGVFVNPMPMFHIGSLGHAGVGGVVRQATHVLACEWEPGLYMKLVAREAGTYSLLVPTMIEAVLAHPERGSHDLSTLKNLISGASVVEAGLVRRTFRELGCTICNTYGQTEMQGSVTAVHADDSDEDKATTIGQALPRMEVKIADPVTGAVLPIGAQGEIRVRGYQNMLGYFDMPEETSSTLTADGWLRSGDLGSMDERGYLKITGRIKDMIIRGGENVYPREIENLLLEHPRIANAAVIGIPDPFWGEQVGAVIQPKSAGDPPDPAELHRFCREHLASYKTPRFWYLATDLPRTETGKLQKFKLVDAVRQGELPLTAQT
jgi:fatty-acyl-CoA synthase